VLRGYGPERVPGRDGVEDGGGLRTDPAARVEGKPEHGRDEQGPDPSPAIDVFPFHLRKIRDGEPFPKGFLPAPPADRPSGSLGVCALRECPYSGANDDLTLRVRAGPAGWQEVKLLA
jgi:hypothetical protein